ncbi:hypothetical protein [Desertivirga xinjiangensis]|uniref:hypothetical protein n=1 Tax=Desertivirga xinjiangensis TaxID=539206 RepID=UPI00210AEC36|nr:hypothetical protein [Pedobacter xinjiangensis]
MKSQAKTKITKLSEKFDKQLLSILADELRLIKAAKSQLVNTLNSNDQNLLVA